MLLENEWTVLLMVMTASVFTVLATVLIHYEAINIISRLIHHRFHQPRRQVLVVIIGVFTAHTLEVWLYAFVYLFLDWMTPVTDIAGDLTGGFLDYLYFSTVSYTSLGLGDLYPVGPVRLLTGIEALNGLLLIAWSASFTYLVMEKRWRL